MMFQLPLTERMKLVTPAIKFRVALSELNILKPAAFLSNKVLLGLSEPDDRSRQHY